MALDRPTAERLLGDLTDADWTSFEAGTFSRTLTLGNDRYIIYTSGSIMEARPDAEFERRTANKELIRRLRDRFLDHVLHGVPR